MLKYAFVFCVSTEAEMWSTFFYLFSFSFFHPFSSSLPFLSSPPLFPPSLSSLPPSLLSLPSSLPFLAPPPPLLLLHCFYTFPSVTNWWFWLVNHFHGLDMWTQFWEAFDKVSYYMLVDKMEKYDLDGRTIRWAHSRLNNCAQRALINVQMPNSREVLELLRRIYVADTVFSSTQNMSC